MTKLEDIRVGSQLTGVVGDKVVTAVAVEWFGNYALTLTYRTEDNVLGETMLYRDMEPNLRLVSSSQWTFDADPSELKLVSEAYRINLAHLFDPYLAVRTSAIDPLPHQISAVYQNMLPKMPLRYVLADDPGAGKTIMAGLLVKTLCGLNKPECWLLAIVEVDGHTTKTTYLRRPALRAPSFAENSVNYDMGRLIESAEVVLERTDTWL